LILCKCSAKIGTGLALRVLALGGVTDPKTHEYLLGSCEVSS